MRRSIFARSGVSAALVQWPSVRNRGRQTQKAVFRIPGMVNSFVSTCERSDQLIQPSLLLLPIVVAASQCLTASGQRNHGQWSGNQPIVFANIDCRVEPRTVFSLSL